MQQYIHIYGVWNGTVKFRTHCSGGDKIVYTFIFTAVISQRQCVQTFIITNLTCHYKNCSVLIIDDHLLILIKYINL